MKALEKRILFNEKCEQKEAMYWKLISKTQILNYIVNCNISCNDLKKQELNFTSWILIRTCIYYLRLSDGKYLLMHTQKVGQDMPKSIHMCLCHNVT